MKRSGLVAAAVVVLAALVVIWMLRGGGDDAAAPAPSEQAATGTADRSGQANQASQGPRRGGDDPPLELWMDDDVAGTLRLEGQVIDDTEDPVAGATVIIDSNPPRTVVTEADGSFAFDKLLGRRYTVAATSDAGVAGPVTATVNEDTEPVILRVKPASTVEVTVLDASSRRPVAGATVELRGLITSEARTGEDGVARLTNAPSGRYQVAAWAEGHARAATFMFLAGGAATEQVELLLKPGAAVTGKVVTEGGAPLAGAQVLYTGVSDWATQAHPRYDAVTTGADGAFRIEAMPAGTFRFIARHADYAPGLSEPVTLDGRTEHGGVIIEAPEGAVLAGRVVDTAGAAVGWAEVRVAREGARFERARQVVADEQGNFELRALPRATVKVVAASDAATSETLSFDLAAQQEKRGVELRLALDGRIAGIVVDSAGEPVEGAQVVAFPDMRGGGRRRGPGAIDWQLRGLAEELSDAGGRFEFRGLEDGEYQVSARPPGSARRGWMFNRDGVAAKVGDTEVRIVLERDGGIKGKVAYDDGKPPELFTVSTGGFRGGTPFSTVDGAFELGEIPPGTYTVTIRGSFDEHRVADVEVAADRITDLGTINVRKGRYIAGRVVDASGAPVEGATVSAGRMVFGTGSSTEAPGRMGPPGAQNVRRAATDARGEFRISGVGAGELTLVADHEERGRSAGVIVPGSTDPTVGVELRLAAFGALEGTVTADGKPAMNVFISTQSQTSPGMIFGVATGPDGKYRYDKLAPDNYKVSVMSGMNPMAGMAFHPRTAVVQSGKTVKLDLELNEGDIALTVSPTVDGQLVGFAQVHTVAGKVTARNAKQLERAIAEKGDAFSSFNIMFGGNPAMVTKLKAGTYTVCALVIPAEVQGRRETIDYMEREGDRLPAFCKTIEVADEPKEQSVEIPVTLPEYVPPPGSSG